MGERSGLWVLLIERNEMGEGREGERERLGHTVLSECVP